MAKDSAVAAKEGRLLVGKVVYNEQKCRGTISRERERERDRE